MTLGDVGRIHDHIVLIVLAELSHNCPTHLLQIGQSLIEALDMNLEQASRWHSQLYRELQREEQLTCVSV